MWMTKRAKEDCKEWRGVTYSFINAVQPISNGPIYHIHCFDMKEKKDVKKEQSSAPSTNTGSSYEGFYFEYLCFLINNTNLEKPA